MKILKLKWMILKSTKKKCKQIMELINEAGLRRSVSGICNCYEMLVKEFIVNIPKDCDNPLSTE